MEWRKALHDEFHNKTPTLWPKTVIADADTDTASTGLEWGASAPATRRERSSCGTIGVDEHMSNTSPSNLEHDKSMEFESSVDRE